jgi:thymidylate synthase ThyX
MLYFCLEQVSILAAKSVEWTRPGTGYIELSTRYVDMHGKEVYPIEKELELFGISSAAVKEVINESFKLYCELQGESYTGPFPKFLRQQYRQIIPEDKLEFGVIGEACDVLGNLLPAATLTSVGVGMSGESLPSMIQHLKLDGTPENLAIAEFIIQEASKVGADQFLRHLDVSDWKLADWEYLMKGQTKKECLMPESSFIEQVLYQAFKQKSTFAKCQSWQEVISQLKQIQRTNFDKLPREFELITAVFQNVMSFRSWRDLHRMGLCTHRRGYITPELGFYRYDKPAPEILSESFVKLHQLNQKLYQLMTEKQVPPVLKQYPLAIGNLIKFILSANLRQLEFCNWQRSKPSVNHEVRQIFLWIENELRKKLPWWSEISRANTIPAYVFARGDSDVPLRIED